MLTLPEWQAHEFYRSFLEWYARWYKPTYLEIGCNRGETLWRIHDYCLSIDAVDPEMYADWNDPNNIERFPNIHYFNMNSNAFFSQHNKGKGYDLIFIDGDHSEFQVDRDITNSLLCLNDDGLIVLHDTYPPTLSHTDEAACGTAYKVRKTLEENLLFQTYTFPVMFGVTLLSPTLVLPWVKEKQLVESLGKC